ncbi:MAG: hypothetical protein HYS13_18625 [Planctomycetia bacterium]|nr:hypothetical protein [Planctomycetia bacterium]
MSSDDRENPAADKRVTNLELLFMELQRTVEQLDGVVRAQQQRLEWIEQQLLHWRRAGSGSEGESPDAAADEPNLDSP